jgi:hypothetical protein
VGKLAIGAVVAAIVLFIWGFVANVLLPLGSTGVTGFPEEAAVTALSATVPESGLYMSPWIDFAESSEEAMEAYGEKATAGPVIFMAYNHEGQHPMSPQALGLQFVNVLVSCFLAALLLTQVSGGFGARFMTVLILGLFAGITVCGPQWNWYGFPTDYTVAQLLQHGIGWFLAAIPLAMMVKPDRS